MQLTTSRKIMDLCKSREFFLEPTEFHSSDRLLEEGDDLDEVQ